jgi:hypothetical protein
MTFARRTLLTALVAAGATLGPVAAAHADDASLKATIAAQDQNLVPSKALTKYGSEKKIGPSQLPAALKVIQAYGPKLTKAANTVAAVTPSSAKGRAGQKAWVAGVRQIAIEYKYIAAELTDLEHGNHAQAGKDLQNALKALTKGKKLLNQADKDLGLPAGA